VRDKVEWEIERRDERAWADRKPSRNPFVSFRPRADIQRKVFAADANRLLRRNRERVD